MSNSDTLTRARKASPGATADAPRNHAQPVHPVVASNPGLNAAQLTLILEVIAGNTRTLQSLLILLQGSDIRDAYQQAVLIDAAEHLATMIGALADDATGGAVHGDAHCWHYGPNFADAGKAVQA